MQSMPASPPPPDCASFLKQLSSQAVGVMLTGGCAVGIDGHPRGRVVLAVGTWSTRSTRSGSSTRSATPASTPLSANPPRFPGPDKAVSFGVYPLRIAIRTAIAGAAHEACFVRRDGVYADDMRLPGLVAGP